MEWTGSSLLRYLLLFIGIFMMILFLLGLLSPYPYTYPGSCIATSTYAGWNQNYFFLFAAILFFLLAIIISNDNKKEKKIEKAVISENQILLDQSSSNSDNNKILDLIKNLLEKDEFAIMKIILENEGVTQDSLHFRTGFSQSKISMIVKKLEEKNLIVRERFGKTYKIYPSEWVKGLMGRANGNNYSEQQSSDSKEKNIT